VSADVHTISVARDALVSALGEAAMIDSAAVIANFQRMVRIADSTGIPLDEPVMMMTQGIRRELDINQFAAAANSPKLGALKGVLGRLLSPLAPRMLKRIAKQRAAK